MQTLMRIELGHGRDVRCVVVRRHPPERRWMQDPGFERELSFMAVPIADVRCVVDGRVLCEDKLVRSTTRQQQRGMCQQAENASLNCVLCAVPSGRWSMHDCLFRTLSSTVPPATACLQGTCEVVRSRPGRPGALYPPLTVFTYGSVVRPEQQRRLEVGPRGGLLTQRHGARPSQ